MAITQDFEVCSLRSAAEAKSVALHCARLQKSLSEALGLEHVTWSPRCQVILHPTQAQYLKAVGPGGASTVGSALVRPQSGKIKVRKIDLRADTQQFLTAALPHELCHVLLADRFREGGPPLWCDEGLAILLDTEAKQLAHERDLRNGERSNKLYTTTELLTLGGYPQSDRWGVFYGQSASLVRVLLRQGDSQALVRFAERIPTVGVNLAVREVYGLEGVSELDRIWRADQVGGSSWAECR